MVMLMMEVDSDLVSRKECYKHPFPGPVSFFFHSSFIVPLPTGLEFHRWNICANIKDYFCTHYWRTTWWLDSA